MSDTDERYDEIKAAIESGNVQRLRVYWYEKVKGIHEKIFRALGTLDPLVNQANIPIQKAAFSTLSESARNVASLDMFIAAANTSYTQFSDNIRRAFRIKFKAIETIKVASLAISDVGKCTANELELHGKIVMLVNHIFDLACETANIDCFRLLLNGYLEDIGACPDDSEKG